MLTALKWSGTSVTVGSLVAAITVRVIGDGAGVVCAVPEAGSAIAPSNSSDRLVQAMGDKIRIEGIELDAQSPRLFQRGKKAIRRRADPPHLLGGPEGLKCSNKPGKGRRCMLRAWRERRTRPSKGRTVHDAAAAEPQKFPK